MIELSFTTDTRLCINSGKNLGAITGRPDSQIIGRKYYEVFPRIFVENEDAVAKAIEKNKPLSFKGYVFNCLYGYTKADIEIRPIHPPTNNSDAVTVFITPQAPCDMAKKLHQSQRLIDIGKIASTLAHGVRNPLNAIKGSVVYLRDKYTDEETLVEFTKIMEEEITRLEDFISRFLSSSVPITDVRETDINMLLKKIDIFTSLQLYTRNIHAFYELGEIPPVMINAFYLEQAILNVINNAIDAMDVGGQLKIRSFKEERSGKAFIAISVSDTGPGMTDRSSEKGSADKGRGFGLTITDEILRHYGGHLEIDSKKDVGTTIRLFIPAQEKQ